MKQIYYFPFLIKLWIILFVIIQSNKLPNHVNINYGNKMILKKYRLLA